jgi:signal transduction histidine kinase/DNA-binding response OmpR family regulator
VDKIERDAQGYLWLTSPAGLARLDPDTGEVQHYDFTKGLLSNSIIDAVLDERQQLWVSTNKGLNSVDVAALPSPRAMPAPVLTELTINGQAWRPADSPGRLLSPEISELSLGHRDRSLMMTFSALAYDGAERTRYRHRLAGLETDWTELPDREQRIVYTTLPRGTYRLEVQARGPNGVWGTVAGGLTISQKAPPWASRTAYAVYVALLLLGIAMIVHMRTRAARAYAEALAGDVKARTREIEAQQQTIAVQARSLEAALEAKNRVFADISHEFRTPLTLIQGPLEEARESTQDPGLRQRLAGARQAGRRLQRLVNQLLDLSRLEAGQQVATDPQPLDQHVLGQVEAFQAVARAKGIVLEARVAEPLWVACCADACEKILSNLVSNAMKFCEPGNTVTVSLARAGEDAIRLCVEDNGPGMSEEIRRNATERFFRGQPADERRPGAGLGLSLVKHLAIACRGELLIEAAPGQGVKAIVLLPRVEPPLAGDELHFVGGETLELELGTAHSERFNWAPLPRAEARPHVHVIEDSTELCAYLAHVLGSDYELSFSSDGDGGLAQCLEGLPDLVLCDAMLPGLDGFELCQRLKMDPRTSHVPVVMLTARADEDSRRLAFAAHADDFITKPFEPEELRLRVANQVSVREILRQKFARQIFVDDSAIASLPNSEQRFVQRLSNAIEAGYSSPDFGLREMAAAVSMSERQVQRKLKALTSLSPVEYLRGFRLRRAEGLLKAGRTVTVVAGEVGFASASYFTRCFKAEYGVAPADYLVSNRPSAVREQTSPPPGTGTRSS